MEKAIINVMAKTDMREIMKIFSAMFSYLAAYFSFLERIERNEKILLAINKIVAAPVNSSIIEMAL